MVGSQDIPSAQDPRVTGSHLRRVSDGPGSILLVGVVHDHPASMYRVRTVTEAVEPAVLALELPPVALPLYEQYAASDHTPPALGGEMSTAIQAAGDASIEGIDRPTVGFFRRLVGTVRSERPSRSTLTTLLSRVAETTTHALACRLAATAPVGPVVLDVDSAVSHETSITDPPAAQATEEAKRVRQSRALLTVFGDDERTRASTLEDRAREGEMADNLRKLRQEGDVVAVVGIDHVDPLVQRLTAE